MQNFIEDLFSWIGFTVVTIIVLYFIFYNKLPKISFIINDQNNHVQNSEKTCQENFAVDLNTYQSNLPTVYSKNCAFTGIKPKGYIPNITDWQKYSDNLP